MRADAGLSDRLDHALGTLDRDAGQVVQLNNGMPAIIAAIDEEGVTIDANHPLAGEQWFCL